MMPFDHAADVVVIGAGGAGLPAAISARDHGASVIVIDANHDVGGHAILSGGNIRLGSGTSEQKKHGITDSPDQVYLDYTNPAHPQYRRSDRDLVRTYANECAATLDFLLENGLVLTGAPPVRDRGDTSPRMVQAKVFSNDLNETIAGRSGSGLTRALERSARAKGVTFLLRHTLTQIMREQSAPRKVVGVAAEINGKEVRIHARHGIIIATGGHTSNVEFRRVFDPRLTEEYQTIGDAWSKQDAAGELLALDIGAALWGVGIQTSDAEREVSGGTPIFKNAQIGCRYGYVSLAWATQGPLYDLQGPAGLNVRDFQDLILVNQIGERFWNELDNSMAFVNACLGPNGNLGTDGKANGGGPIWAIFDQAAVERERWVTEPPYVDRDGWFFSANSIGELASKIVNPYQRRPILPAVLEATVEKYNSYVDQGHDPDFGRPPPLDGKRIASLRNYMIQTPPFYAAWATPILHDSLTGLRIDPRCRVLDWRGHAIPGLYCAGEAAGGFGLHGLGRATVFGRIAGREASRVEP